jgi:hypothetical protein
MCDKACLAFWHDFCNRTFNYYLQMLIIYGQELQSQLQKSCQTCFIASGKKFIIGGISVVLHLKVTSNSLIYQTKLDVFDSISVYLVFIFHLLINVNIL